jgi:5-methylcytosine-specific restriction endonuclease McrA
MNKRTYSDDQLACAVRDSRSANETLLSLGLVIGGANRKSIWRHINRLDLDVSHWDYGRRPQYSMEEILVENSTYRNLTALKKRLVDEGLLEYLCSECGIDTWLGKPITLQLHHKNGKQTDHRLFNLEILCPNCHTQTETYAGRNKPQAALDL